MVEDAQGKAVNLIGAIPGHDAGAKELAGFVELAVVEINDAELFMQGLCPLGLALELGGLVAKGLVDFLIGLDGGLVEFVEVKGELDRELRVGGRLGGLYGCDGVIWLLVGASLGRGALVVVDIRSGLGRFRRSLLRGPVEGDAC